MTLLKNINSISMVNIDLKLDAFYAWRKSENVLVETYCK